MPTEIEKKYRLTAAQAEAVRHRLREVGAAEVRGEEFEENTIYGGPGLDPRSRVLRLRRVGARAVLTYKERSSTDSAIKRQREEETGVGDAGAVASILDALGYRAALVYEKRRTTWEVAGAEVVLDELPFGLFMEIEGDEGSIAYAESLLGLAGVVAEHSTYPDLALRHGAQRGDLVEARFDPPGGSTLT